MYIWSWYNLIAVLVQKRSAHEREGFSVTLRHRAGREKAHFLQALLTIDSRKAALASPGHVLILEALPAANRAPIHCCLRRVTEHFTIAYTELPEIRFTKSYFLKDRFFF